MPAMDRTINALKAIWPTITAVAVDLDGTILTPEPRLTDRVRDALRAVLASGREVLICTGRSAASAEPFRNAIGCEGPMVYYNGAMVVDTPSQRVRAAFLLDARLLKVAFDLAREEDLYLHCFSEDGALWCPRRSGGRSWSERELYRSRTGQLPVETDIDELLFPSPGRQRNAIKAMFIAEPERLDAITPILAERAAVCSADLASRGTSVPGHSDPASDTPGLYLTRSQASYLELLSSKANKGDALKEACALRGLDPAHVLAFGDGENDIPLLDAAGWSIAMAPAPVSLKAHAKGIAPSAIEDGVAVILDALL